MNARVALLLSERHTARTTLSYGQSALVFAAMTLVGFALFIARHRIWERNARVFPSRYSSDPEEYGGEPLYIVCCVAIPGVLAAGGALGCVISLARM